MDDRLTQLLGVTALAAAERLRTAVGGEPEAAALVHLQAWPGGSVGELAGVVGRSQAATVRLVDRLAERGLVRRSAGPDRRTVALHVTAAGAQEADALLARRAAQLSPLLDGLSAAERAALQPLLERVVAGLAEDRPGAVHACRLCDRGACATGPGCPLDHTVQPGGPAPSLRRSVTPPQRGGRG